MQDNVSEPPFKKYVLFGTWDYDSYGGTDDADVEL